MNSRWLNTSQAAKYCGYKSAGHFRRIAAEYKVPRYGPAKNRYDVHELDVWMQDPEVFCRSEIAAKYLRRRWHQWKPV